MDDQIDEKQHKTALILANAGELAAAVIKRIAGNDISTALNGSPLTREVVQSMVMRVVVEEVIAAG